MGMHYAIPIGVRYSTRVVAYLSLPFSGMVVTGHDVTALPR